MNFIVFIGYLLRVPVVVNVYFLHLNAIKSLSLLFKLVTDGFESMVFLILNCSSPYISLTAVFY